MSSRTPADQSSARPRLALVCTVTATVENRRGVANQKVISAPHHRAPPLPLQSRQDFQGPSQRFHRINRASTPPLHPRMREQEKVEMKSSRFNNTTASSWRVLLPRTTYSLGEGEVMREYRRVASQSRIGDLKGGGGGEPEENVPQSAKRSITTPSLTLSDNSPRPASWR